MVQNCLRLLLVRNVESLAEGRGTRILSLVEFTCQARSEHRRQFRFCWDIYDAAGMSIRTPASRAGRYPMQKCIWRQIEESS